MDEFYEYLLMKNIDVTVVDAFRNIVMFEEYDSQTVGYDVLNECNISNMIQNKNCFQWIQKFVKDAHSMFVLLF